MRSVWIGLACALVILAINQGDPGRDADPLISGLRAEIAGQSAYGPEHQAQARAAFAAAGPTRCERCSLVGLAYPAPALLLALPTLLALPVSSAAAAVWLLLSLVLLVAALRRTMPAAPWWLWLLWTPLLHAARTSNPSLLLLALLLLGLWAAQQERWGLVAIVVALTIAAKPQTTLLLSGYLAWRTLRAGHGKPLLAAAGTVALVTLALEPTWPMQWLQIVWSYRSVTAESAVWLWWLLPLAGWLLGRGYTWPGLALLQVLLFPVNIQAPYAALPLLAGYATLPHRRHTPWVIWASWGFLGVALVAGYPPAVAGCLLLPMVAIAIMEDKEKRGTNYDAHLTIAHP